MAQQWPGQLCCDSSHLEMVGCLTETRLWFPSGFFQWLIVRPLIPSSDTPVKEINKQIQPSLGQSNHFVSGSERSVITNTLSPPLVSPRVQLQLQRSSEARTRQTGPRVTIRMSAASRSPMHLSSSDGEGSANEAWERQFPWSGAAESRPALGCELKTTVVRD